LDLGCGTGLGGQAFRELVQTIDGVDLSKKMIAVAETKKCYRQLTAGNIATFLKTTQACYDFYLAADVFAYVGELTETLTLLRQRAHKDVLFCFSTENWSGDGFFLQQTGRFAHSPAYIEEVARSTGWTVAARETTSLRKEKGSWVSGDLWFLRLREK